MTDRANRVLGQGRLILTLAAVFVIAGLAAFMNMNRQENPSFPYRAGLITIAFDGASPGRIERLVLNPLEEEIAEVGAVDTIRSTVRQGVALVKLRLKAGVYDTANAWDRVRVAMDDAARDYPAGVGTANLDDRIIDSSTIVLAVTGDASPLRLADAAKTLRRHLLSVDGVASTELYGDPGKQITIAIDDAAINRNGLSPSIIAADIRGSNKVATGGAIRLAGASINLKPATDFASLAAIRATTIALPGGNDTLPLAAIADIHKTAVQPPRSRLWYDGERGVGVEVVASRNSLNVVDFGERVRDAVDAVRDRLAPLEIHEMFYQPAHTRERLTTLTHSLLLSIAIILGLLLVFMGWRMGVIVALLLPLVTLTAVALYALGGGILQQIAIMGLVVSLGILVDNAIVMTENVQWHLNAGESADYAASHSIRELAGPLLAATGTTLSAFVPMLLADGNTADFTRALPITIMASLSVSYIFAIAVTPLICRRYLRAQPQGGGRYIERLAGALAGLTTARPVWLTLAGALMVVIAFGCLRFVNQEFFPAGDRNLVIVDITLPEGAHIAHTQTIAQTLERALRGRKGVEAIHSFVGTGGPVFYYSLQQSPKAPQQARLVVMTDRRSRNQSLLAYIEAYSASHVPEADIVASTVTQGPPTKSPIAVRVFNRDPERLVEATEQVFRAALTLPGSRDVRHDLGIGAPSIDYNIVGGVAKRYGITPVDVAQAVRGRSQGLVVGQYRAEKDPIPIKLRSPEGERFSPAALETASVYTDRGQHVPLMQVATTRLAIQPGAIRHYNQRRVAHVYSELQRDTAYSRVLTPLRHRLDDMALPPGTDIQYGGNVEQSGKANNALSTTAPLGLALLLFFLLVQFNSFIRIGLVLLTAPFALVGVVPGLIFLDIPFGFMPLLGLFALTGIVVNNAIVLIDVIDQHLQRGEAVGEAVAAAVRRRTRPIILTTATTIAGLLPLAFSSATLWPPMAWPIITGLLASTLLTLLVLPAICQLVLRPPKHNPVAALAIVVSVGLVAGVASSPAAAAPSPRVVTFAESLRLSQQRPDVAIDRHAAEAADAGADRTRRAGRYPALSVQAYARRSDTVARITDEDVGDDLGTAANGLPQNFSIPIGSKGQAGATVELRQPILDAANQLYGTGAADKQASAARARLARSRTTSLANAAGAYLDTLSLEARLRANRALIANLDAQAGKIKALRRSGRALKSDVLEVVYKKRRARQQQQTVRQRYELAQAQLARALGLPGRAQPAGLDFYPPPVSAGLDKLTARALDARRDLQALDARIAAAALQAKQVRARRLPTLDAVASLRYSKGSAFRPEHEGRIGAQLTWRPFAGGTLSAAHRRANARLAQLRARRTKLLNSARIQIQQALADLHDARQRTELATLGLESARATRATRSARLNAGRSNIDDLLDAEARLAERQTGLRTARYDVVDAWVRLQAAIGNTRWVSNIADHPSKPAGPASPRAARPVAEPALQLAGPRRELVELGRP